MNPDNYRPNLWMYDGDYDAHVIAWRECESIRIESEAFAGYYGGGMHTLRSMQDLNRRYQRLYADVQQNNEMSLSGQALANALQLTPKQRHLQEMYRAVGGTNLYRLPSKRHWTAGALASIGAAMIGRW